jgi:hypothetical protein
MSEYQPMVQEIKMTFTCHNCHTKVVVNPEDQESVNQTSEWLQVIEASGARFAYHNVDCLQKGAHFHRPKSGLVTL